MLRRERVHGHLNMNLKGYTTIRNGACLSMMILKKRECYRAAFENYDLHKLAELDEDNVPNIIENFDVVKHKGKIASVYNNARAALELQKEFGSLSNALWQFVDNKVIDNQWTEMSQVPASTGQSKAMSKFLKKRGFKFVGETICYAFMQATGMVNDHMVCCAYR